MSYDWIETARLAGKVERTHIVDTLEGYNVAEHTYNAMVIAFMMCDAMLAEHLRKEVIEYLLFHDVEEVHTGDLPAYMKNGKHLPESFGKILDTIERSWLLDNAPNSVIDARENVSDISKLIAKVADSAELCMFCTDEIRKGNHTPSMLEMSRRAVEYLLDNVKLLVDTEYPNVRIGVASVYHIASKLEDLINE